MKRNSKVAIGLETVGYIEDMLAELRNMSRQAGQPMLTYLIEMAMVEASEAAAGRGGVRHGQDNPMQSEIAHLFDNPSLK